jgi:cysteinyl-tRNA synthetase
MLRLYNTLTHRKELVEPIEPGLVKIYSCGPTVYRYIHIGNLRTFAMSDWIRRTLAYIGLNVLHVKNITDVGHMRVELLDRGEDKLIAQARKEGRTSAEIAAFYTAAFLEDEAALNILPAHVLPRATEHVPEMITIIVELIANGMAYAAGGNIYFDVTRFPDYGKLSGNQLAGMIESVRDTADLNKRNPEDFALWKAAEAGRELAWESPWGRGFPGWHIECSAMSMKYLGKQFDIHTGGVDNIFPHHEDEIAQSEGFTGHPFVNIWAHAQHLLADGLKMAKSTGNAYTRKNVESRGFEPLALRYLYATTHYRCRLNFTFGALRAAQIGLNRLRLAALRLNEATAEIQHHESQQVIDQYRDAFRAALSDDLNLPRALAVVWKLLRRDTIIPPAETLALLHEFDQVLGFGLTTPIPHAEAHLPVEIAALIAERTQLRIQKRYAEADSIRSHVAAAGFQLRDTPTGTLAVQLAADEEFPTITRSAEAPDLRDTTDQHAFSINLLAHDSRDDLARCIASIVRQRDGVDIEIVVIDNGSTDQTVAYLQDLARSGIHDESGQPVALTIIFADHNLGFAAGRNATSRASSGRIIIWLDTSIELQAPIWHVIEQALAEPEIGLVGPYGLITSDMKEFQENEGPDVDVIEGYLMAFRRDLHDEIGQADEKFRFYRLMDIAYSFQVKTAGYRVQALPALATLIEKHPHREWYSLSEEDRATKSKKNFDIYKRRWHHGQSLLTVNYDPAMRWFGHNHPDHLGPGHWHTPEELPPPGQPHRHQHQHWPDHAHVHEHYHE